MKRYFAYILTHYTKNFLMILLAITMAVTLVDYLQHSDRLTGTLNQTLMYMTYTWMSTVTRFYPLAIVFAATVTYMSLVSSNTLVSMLSFGYSKQRLFWPFVIPAVLFYALMMYLQFGEFAYAQERSVEILNKKNNAYIMNDMLFRYNNDFVYVNRLDPVKKVLYDVVLFDLDGTKVTKVTSTKSAKYEPPYWVTKSAVIMSKTFNKEKELSGFTTENISDYKFLKDYKPKVIELIYEGESLTIPDAYNAHKLLKQQNLNSVKIKAVLYNKVIIPLFAFAMVILIFFKTPYYERYINKELIWAVALGGTMLAWGIFYALFNVAKAGALSPDIAMLIPVVLFLLYAIYVLVRADKKLV